jgi:hypothetical protein
MLATAVGRPADATRDLARAESELRAVGDSWVLSWCYANGATAALAQGDPVTAARQARAGVAALKAEPDWHYVSRALDALAESGAAWLASPAGASHPPPNGRRWRARRRRCSAPRQACASAAAPPSGHSTARRTRLRSRGSATRSAPPSSTRDGRRDGRSRSTRCSRSRLPPRGSGRGGTAGTGASPAHECRRPATHAASELSRPAPRRRSAATTLRIRVLGPLLVVRDGAEVPLEAWRSAKARELLFYLVLHGPRSREQIGLALWPDASMRRCATPFTSRCTPASRARRARLGGVRRQRVRAIGVRGTSHRRPVDAASRRRTSTTLLALRASAQRACAARTPLDGGALVRVARRARGRAGELGEGTPAGDWLVEHQDRVRAGARRRTAGARPAVRGARRARRRGRRRTACSSRATRCRRRRTAS